MTLFVLVAPGGMFLVIKSRTFGVNWPTGHFTPIFTQILHPILPGGVMVELFFPEIREG